MFIYSPDVNLQKTTQVQGLFSTLPCGRSGTGAKKEGHATPPQVLFKQNIMLQY